MGALVSPQKFMVHIRWRPYQNTNQIQTSEKMEMKELHVLNSAKEQIIWLRICRFVNFLNKIKCITINV